jgi:hypothetical protein
MLLSRGQRQDRPHAIRLVDQASRAAQGMGMAYLAQKIRNLTIHYELIDARLVIEHRVLEREKEDANLSD